MARSAHYEGGLNTITYTIPAGTTANLVVGKMPKNGKIVRVRYTGRVAETDFTAQLFRRNVDGTSPMAFTNVTGIGAAFNSIESAFSGIEAVFVADQGLRDLKDGQPLSLLPNGTLAGELILEIAFEPR